MQKGGRSLRVVEQYGLLDVKFSAVMKFARFALVDCELLHGHVLHFRPLGRDELRSELDTAFWAGWR
eukprot:3172331-Pleurochrysis_carterae.AAC.2